MLGRVAIGADRTYVSAGNSPSDQQPTRSSARVPFQHWFTVRAAPPGIALRHALAGTSDAEFPSDCGSPAGPAGRAPRTAAAAQPALIVWLDRVAAAAAVSRSGGGAIPPADYFSLLRIVPVLLLAARDDHQGTI